GIAWGELDSADAPIYYAKNGFTILNLTPLYSDTTGLTVEVLDQNSAPVESADVWISVFNFSSLRAVAHHYTDKEGRAHFVLGKAALFVSAGKDSLWNYAIMPLFPGDTTYQITLTLSRTDIPDTAFWLPVVKEVKVEKDTSYKPDSVVYCRHNLKQERLTACPKEIMEILPDSSEVARLLDCLNRGRGNREAMIAFWKAHPDQHEDILNLWEAMATKDLVIPDSATWEKLWGYIQEMRDRYSSDSLDSIFWNYVANPRILWEDFGFWYPEVFKRVKKYVDKDFERKLEAAKRIVSRLDTLTDKSYFGGMMNPAQVLRARTGGKLERLGVFVAALRAMGIPARIGWDYRSAEYLSPLTNEWERFELPGSEEEKPAERTTGMIRAKFVFNGQTTTDVDYYDDFSLNKISDGVFDDITPPKEVVDSFVIFRDVPVGEYAFMTGWRNGYGAPFVRIKPFEVSEGTTYVEVEGGFPPPEMVSAGDLVVRKFTGLGDVKIKDVRGRRLKKSDWQKGTLIVAFFDTEHESSISTAKVLAKVEDVPKIIFVATKSRAQAKKFCRQNGLSGRIFYADEETLKKVLKFRQLPSILLLSDGEAIMWTEGLNLAVEKLIEQLLTR
ncbi:transglutaminase domain-containing protein, partial [bacterium]|nr:transglutaminase domain-containing protein [bacterium]